MTSLIHLDATQLWIRSPYVPLRAEELMFSHYASPIPSECALVFGHLHPELFWEYILAVRPSYTLIRLISSHSALDPRANESHSLSRLTPQIYSVQERYYNVPSANLTPDQIRDQLAEVALDVLEKQGKLGQGPKSAAYGQLRDAFTVKEKDGGKNKGTGMFDAQKHISEYTLLAENRDDARRRAGSRLIL
jgi:hypothetical protein